MSGMPADPDPIPQLRYCRCLPCCCSPGEGHKSPEYLAWEARRHLRDDAEPGRG